MKELNFTIWAQNGVSIDIRRADIPRDLITGGCCVCLHNGVILGEYCTRRRAFEVFRALKKAALTGQATFVFPKI